jgi:hypothetical protein
VQGGPRKQNRSGNPSQHRSMILAKLLSVYRRSFGFSVLYVSYVFFDMHAVMNEHIEFVISRGIYEISLIAQML